MLTIDGRTGGGQLLRTALSLSALTGTAFEPEDLRADRPRPGLTPQHLAAFRALASCCDADEAVDRCLASDETAATVDGHLADQLLVFLALAGGRFGTPGQSPSRSCRTVSRFHA